MSMLSKVQLRLHTMREWPLQKVASTRLFIPRGGSHRRGTECIMKGLLDCFMDGNFSAAMGAAWAAERAPFHRQTWPSPWRLRRRVSDAAAGPQRKLRLPPARQALQLSR